MENYNILNIENWTDLLYSKDLKIVFNNHGFTLFLYKELLSTIPVDEVVDWIKENDFELWDALAIDFEGLETIDDSVFIHMDYTRAHNARLVIQTYFKLMKNKVKIIC